MKIKDFTLESTKKKKITWKKHMTLKDGEP